jgi:hypothetical protein
LLPLDVDDKNRHQEGGTYYSDTLHSSHQHGFARAGGPMLCRAHSRGCPASFSTDKVYDSLVEEEESADAV